MPAEQCIQHRASLTHPCRHIPTLEAPVAAVLPEDGAPMVPLELPAAPLLLPPSCALH